MLSSLDVDQTKLARICETLEFKLLSQFYGAVRSHKPAAKPVSNIDAETAAVLAALHDYSADNLSRKLIPFMVFPSSSEF